MLDIADNWQTAWQNSKNDPHLFATGVLGFLPAGAPNPDEKFQLAAWQDKLLREFFTDPQGNVTDSPRHTIRSGHGVGKLQPKSEPVLTPQGWRDIGSIKVGDLVATVDGSFTPVTGVFPNGKQTVFKVVLDDGTWTLAGKDHLWLTTSRSERKHGLPGKVRTTGEIASSLTFPNGPRHGYNHCLPRLSRPIQHAHVDLPVDPYLLGVYLGDGTYSGVITLNAKDASHYADALGENFKEPGVYIYRKAENSLVAEAKLKSEILQAIKGLGLEGLRSWEKFIPPAYLCASPEQRLALLNGLLDTDGTVGETNNAVMFDTSSLALADGISELVRSLGGVARRSGRQGRLYGVDKRWSYRVYVALPEESLPFRCPRKAKRYRPHHGHKNKSRTLNRFIVAVEHFGEEDCVCIAVAHPSQLYVTRDHIVTHNTTMISILAIWFVLTHYDSKIVISANSQDQLRDNNWSELRKILGMLPDALRDMLDLREERLVVAAAPEMGFVVRRTASKHNPEALQGIHAEHVLYLVDESSGVEDIVFEVAQGSLSTKGACAVLFSNPTRNSGFFFNTHNSLRHRWRSWVVSSEDVPRARGHIEDVIAAYGKGSNKYRVRVLGEFPTADDETVIPLEWVEAAINRDVETLRYVPIWGVDVARFGDDNSALAKRQANKLLEPIKEWNGINIMSLTGRIHNEYVNTHPDLQPKEILVDVIGMGSGLLDRLLELGLPARGVNVGERPSSDDRMMRLRDELWWRGRSWFEAQDCSIPDDQKLVAELVAPLYDYHSSGKVVVEPKKEMKKRGLRSPNKADALMLTFAGNSHRIQPIIDVHRNRGRLNRDVWAS